MSTQSEFGVTQVSQRVRARLHRYLEAQYHIRTASLIEERRLALEEPGCISQRPFVEVTPSYAVVPDFVGLNADPIVTTLLQELAGWKDGVGVFPPYKHQAEALERFFPVGRGGDDLIVATGTGSGKTETFLYAILGMLAREGQQRPASFRVPAVRALLLYPMNALVSDQTARLRKMLGDERLAELFRTRWGRHPRFGMYTSRSPYPGVRTAAKDGRHLDALLSYYEQLETSADEEDQILVRQLRDRGRWPAKDIIGFYARDREERVVIKTGKKAGETQARHHWDRRLLTQPGDRELLTRHEMQLSAPDLLITNYSMLEYMLLRPIERPLFSATRSWLAADKRNQLLLVLDEAHMYRGVGGAEVGLLLRRLLSRLGVGRERLRCILTSASLGSTASAEAAGKDFARSLTGESSGTTFAVIRGTKEARTGARPASSEEAAALSAVNPAFLAAARVAPQDAQSVVDAIAAALRWPPPPRLSDNEIAVRQYVCTSLSGFGPLELLIRACSGEATAFVDLAVQIFPTVSQATAEKALDGLLALGTFARRTEPGRAEQPLLPTRVHLLFRGLPSLFVCINPNCTDRRDRGPGPFLVGRLFTEPRTHCACGGRVYELLTHRDCGAAFLRVFVASPTGEFFWHERGGTLTEYGRPLHELHLFLEEPHPSEPTRRAVTPVVIDIATGRALSTAADPVLGSRLCYRASDPPDGDPALSTFGVCPACTRPTQTGGSLKIMDLATKGEQPFANLVREQFVTQLPTKTPSESHPNEGRKALLFSDGRQKAARLARDLPREVERDSFREAVALAIRELSLLPSPQDAVPDERLYASFVAVCSRFHLHFFDGPDQKALLEECRRFRRDYGGDLELATEQEWKPAPPKRYRQALLRQIGDPYYSLVAACAATVEVRRNKLRLIRQRVGAAIADPVLEDVVNGWMREMLGHWAFDPALAKDARLNEFAYFNPVEASDGLKRFWGSIRQRTGLDAAALDGLRDALFDIMTRTSTAGDDSGRLVTADSLVLRIAVDDTWLQCLACGYVQRKPFLGACENCADRRLEERPPNHSYMVARKDFFRGPLRNVLSGERPVHITAEEHTAQLSQRDAGVVYATTEQFELRFQDVPLGEDKPSVDILSCTTTMEVGIDIGSLTAVGLRTMPPQRENYQQRAGRAGRRGTSVSSVLTYAQGGAHDAHYFANPASMISGPPRDPRIKSDNRRLARRHIHSHLLQTFFHEQIDALSAQDQRRLQADRSGIMSAFGDARGFFTGDGPFSFNDFEDWLLTNVLVPNSAHIDQIASWLPPEVGRGGDLVASRKALVREVAEGLRRTLQGIKEAFLKSEAPNDPAAAQDQDDDDDDDTSGMLLDTLFARGLLPSYAFPTDLCGFVIQKWNEGQVRVAERPQLGKSQALSEYAPGRLLVVNKLTYRVGGIFVDGPPTAAPAAPLFAQPPRRYVGCLRCSFVRLERSALAGATVEGTPCPVCTTHPLYVRDLLDPPGFSPEKAKPVAEGDRDQEVTYASSAQLPELVERDEFEWRDGPGVNLRHAYREEVQLIVTNKGKDATGFSVCDACGASWLDGEEPSAAHPRPFLLPNHVRNRENAPAQCAGQVRRQLFLGHDFRTDILLLQVSFRPPFDANPERPWFYDAIATLAEALALGASRHLQIDPGDLSAGQRLLPGSDDEIRLAEIFLFDTASGGAGYAADAGAELADVLAATEKVLTDCPGRCERSCTQCLRHYGNRFLHGRLDRRLGAALLRYMRMGEAPSVPASTEQARTLAPLGRFLTLEGWAVESNRNGLAPLVARHSSGRTVVVGTHPALLRSDAAAISRPLEEIGGAISLYIPDYLVERDLPSAYQMVAGLQPAPLNARSGVAAADFKGAVTELPLRELRRLGSGGLASGSIRVRIAEDVPEGAFASRTPSGSLRTAGFPGGAVLVLRPPAKKDVGSDRWLVLTRARGRFQATGEPWTVARVKQVDDGGSRLQLSYGGATGREFRPERADSADISIAAAVVCLADEVS